MSALLSWSHYCELLKLNDEYMISYYIKISEEQNLSVRQLIEKIKSKEYERLDDNKTVGLIICKENNQFVIEYCSDERIVVREYKIM